MDKLQVEGMTHPDAINLLEKMLANQEDLSELDGWTATLESELNKKQVRIYSVYYRRDRTWGPVYQGDDRVEAVHTFFKLERDTTLAPLQARVDAAQNELGAARAALTTAVYELAAGVADEHA